MELYLVIAGVGFPLVGAGTLYLVGKYISVIHAGRADRQYIEGLERKVMGQATDLFMLGVGNELPSYDEMAWAGIIAEADMEHLEPHEVFLLMSQAREENLANDTA